MKLGRYLTPHIAAFSVLEVLVAVAFTALVLGTALSALSAAGLYLSRTHERLLFWDEEYNSLLSEAQKFIDNPENLPENEEKFRFREKTLYVESEEGEEEISVLKVELKAYPFWFFVCLPEE